MWEKFVGEQCNQDGCEGDLGVDIAMYGFLVEMCNVHILKMGQHNGVGGLVLLGGLVAT